MVGSYIRKCFQKQTLRTLATEHSPCHLPLRQNSCYLIAILSSKALTKELVPCRRTNWPPRQRQGCWAVCGGPVLQKLAEAELYSLTN